MAAPTSHHNNELYTSELQGDSFCGRYDFKIPQTGTKFYQDGNVMKSDSFKMDIDAYDTSMDIADLRQRAVMNGGPRDNVMGPIQPFARPQQGVVSKLMQEFWLVISEKEAKRVVFLGVFNILCMIVLLLWCQSTNSMALSAYTYLMVCNLMLLVTCLITIWVSQQKPASVYSFGFERFEVLAVFSCTMLATFGAIFIMKESTERLFQPIDVHTSRLMLGAGLGLICHIAVIYGTDSKAFGHVIEASRSSWLQEHFADISRNFCAFVPGLDRLLLPRVNPFVLIAFAGATSLFFANLLIDVNNYFIADTLAAFCIALMIFGTMFPMSLYTGTILLQTSPAHITGQLDKSLREASTLDGVLEFRNEHFWTISFGTIAGSLHVRVRRDANEQMVLAHVANKLAHLVTTLTIQVIKDDWTRLTPLASFTSEPAMIRLPPPAPLSSSLAASSPLQPTQSPDDKIGLMPKPNLYSFRFPSTPSRASSTPYGSPSSTPNQHLSFHSDIGPISSRATPQTSRAGDARLKGILRTSTMGVGTRGGLPNVDRFINQARSAVIDVNSLGTADLYTTGKLLTDQVDSNFHR